MSAIVNQSFQSPWNHRTVRLLPLEALKRPVAFKFDLNDLFPVFSLVALVGIIAFLCVR